MDSMQHYIIASSNPLQKDKDRSLKQSLYHTGSAFLLDRKLRQIVRNGVCISIARAVLRNADYVIVMRDGTVEASGTTTVIDSTGKPAAYACRVMRPEPVKRRMTEARP